MDQILSFGLKLRQRLLKVTPKKYLFEKALNEQNFNVAITKQIVEAIMKNKQINIKQYPQIRYILQKKAQIGNVCAKVIKNGENIVECLDCRADPSCIVCLDCYKNGKHDGHRIVIKIAGGGCCDCGDKDAWKQQGFCVFHSEFRQQIPLETPLSKALIDILEDLFLIYFRISLQKKYQTTKYCQQLIRTLIMFTTKGGQYSNFLNQFFERKPKYCYDQQLKGQSYLQALYTYQIFYETLKMWQELFFKMFTCYAFKLQLLSVYLNKFDKIISSDYNSQSISTIISCQLLTSNGLVKDYIRSERGRPFLLQPGSHNQQILVLHYFANLTLLMKLKDGVGKEYVRFHIHKRGIASLFVPYEQLKITLEKEGATPRSTIHLLKHSNYIQIQLAFIEVLLTMVHLADQQTLLIIIKYCFNRLKYEPKQRVLIMYKPYQRALFLSLFAYFKGDLDAINLSTVSYLLEEQEQIVAALFQQLFQQGFTTSMFYSQITTTNQRGLRSSFNTFIYFYTMKDKILQVIDTIWIKISLLICPTALIPYKDIFQIVVQENEFSVLTLVNTFQQFKYLYIDFVSQLWLANRIKIQNNFFKEVEASIIIRFMNSKKKSVAYKDMIQFGKNFLTLSEEQIRNKVMQFCSFDKGSKKFILKQNFETTETMIFSNYRSNNLNIKENNDILETKKQILTYNRAIFQSIWSVQNINNLFSFLFQGINKNDLKLIGLLIQSLSKILQLMKQFKMQFSFQIQDFIKFKLLTINDIDKHINEHCKQLFLKTTNQSNFEKLQQNAQIQRLNSLKSKRNSKKQQLLKRKNKNIFQQKTIEQESQTQTCMICRKADQNLCYLSKSFSLNHQKLLRLDLGKQITVFSSCFHIVHFSCLVTVQKPNIPYIKCPICKIQANICLPITNYTIDNFVHIYKQLQLQLPYQQIDLFICFIISFYQFVLIALIDFNQAAKKKKIYLLLLKILMQYPHHVKNIYKQYLFQSSINIQINQKLSIQKQQIQNQMQMKNQLQKVQNQQKQINESNNDSDSWKQQNKGKRYFFIKKKKNNIFKTTMDQIFAFLLHHDPPSNKNKKVQFIIKSLINNQFVSFEQVNYLQQQKYIFKLRALPQTYLFHNFICDGCKKESRDLFLCLLCQWQCCFDCPHGISSHNIYQHGPIGSFMHRNKGNGYFWRQGKLQPVGCIYKDQFGGNFDFRKDWSSFGRCDDILDHIKKTLIFN